MDSRTSVDVVERIPSGADRGWSLYWLWFYGSFLWQTAYWVNISDVLFVILKHVVVFLCVFIHLWPGQLLRIWAGWSLVRLQAVTRNLSRYQTVQTSSAARPAPRSTGAGLHKEKSNKMQQSIKLLLFHIYMKLNMFRATHRPSSGA
jgi:signal transduction histidine kinase